jgi:DNA (cytosine-5)-methyltransferase 1
MFRYIDLFAGIGGFRIALDSSGGKCVYSSELNPSCREVYKANFGDDPAGDIKQADENSIPDHDVLAGGFPCQAFSIAGNKRGFEDTRGTLFFEVLRIAKAKRPKVLFLENVKNLVHHDGGKTLEVIRTSLEEQGYHFSWEVLNTKDFGLAQNRERTIIVAAKEKTFDFKPVKNRRFKKTNIEDIMEKAGDFEVLDPSTYTILDESLLRRQKSGLVFAGYRNKPARKNGVRPNTKHLSRVHKQPNRIYHVSGTHPTLASQETAGRFWIYDGKDVRKLTVRECYSLQGFPKNFAIGTNKGNAYRQIGNSVGIPVIKAVAEEIIRQIL